MMLLPGRPGDGGVVSTEAQFVTNESLDTAQWNHEKNSEDSRRGTIPRDLAQPSHTSTRNIMSSVNSGWQVGYNLMDKLSRERWCYKLQYIRIG